MNAPSAKLLTSFQLGFNSLRDQFDRHPVIAPILGGMATAAVLVGAEFATDGMMTTFILNETILPAAPEAPVILP